MGRSREKTLHSPTLIAHTLLAALPTKNVSIKIEVGHTKGKYTPVSVWINSLAILLQKRSPQEIQKARNSLDGRKHCRRGCLQGCQGLGVQLEDWEYDFGDGHFGGIVIRQMYDVVGLYFGRVVARGKIHSTVMTNKCLGIV